MPDAFYERDGDRFLATELTRGPWDPGAQHAGPPSALIGREIERLPEDAEDFQVGRVTFEILRPVPIGPVAGRGAGRAPGPPGAAGRGGAAATRRREPLMRARAWRLRTRAARDPARGADRPSRAAARARAGLRGRVLPDRPGPRLPHGDGVAVRSSGGFLEPGPATVWMRMRQPLVAGEEPSPLQRTLVIADVGNGISAVLDYRRYLFINVDLTVHLERMPEGEWVCVDAVTLPQPNGIGTAESVLSDRRRPHRPRRPDAAVRGALAGAARPAGSACAARRSRGRSSPPRRSGDRGARAGRRPRSRSAPPRAPASGAPSPTPASKKAVKVPSAAPRRRLGDPVDDDQRERGVEQREGGAHRQRAGDRHRQALGEGDRGQARPPRPAPRRSPPGPGRPGRAGRRRPAG